MASETQDLVLTPDSSEPGQDLGTGQETQDSPELERAEQEPVAEAAGDNESAETTLVEQAEASKDSLSFAIVEGNKLTELPKDLYIPPDALEVILETFEGPLDLLLYLIRRQNLDILAINVSDITQQYIQYVEMMSSLRFELAAEYLVMAAMLAEIKSRMLLPRSADEEEEEEDPRAQLIRRLQEYERFKVAAEDLNALPRLGRDLHQVTVAVPEQSGINRPEPDVDIKELLLALSEVLRRADMFESHRVEKEKLSTRERMSQVLASLEHGTFIPFVSLFTLNEGRIGVVVTFLAVMELVKESLVEIIQTEAFGPIHVKARHHAN